MASRGGSRRGSDIRAVRQDFLWNGRFPVGHITVIGGQPGVGKSSLGYRAAAEIDEPTIFVSFEEVPDTIWKPRLQAAGVDPAKAFHHPEVKFGRGEEGYLAELVERYRAKLVVVDVLQNHLKGLSIFRDEAMRRVLEPYWPIMQELAFSTAFEVHVLRDIPRSAHPLRAIPAGVVSSAKAVFLFAEHPGIGADPNLRVLDPCKFNFGPPPNSLLFELDAEAVRVFDEKTGRWETDEFPVLRLRGEVSVSAKALLVKMRPEDRERKSDRISHELLELLRHGPVAVGQIKAAVDALDPPVAWRTAQRVAEDLGIVKEQDERDARKLIWRLPDYILAELDEAGDDEVEIIEVDVEPPDDVFPEDWTGDGS